jgi:hypothetical protein
MKISLKILPVLLMTFVLFESTEARGDPQNPTEFSVCSSLDLAPPDCFLVYHQYENNGGKFSVFLLDDGSAASLVLSDYESESGSNPEGNGSTKRVSIDADLRSKLLERFTKALLGANQERIRATTGSTHYYISVRSGDGEVLCGEAIEALPDSQVMEIRTLGRLLQRLVEEAEPESQRSVRSKVDALLL